MANYCFEVDRRNLAKHRLTDIPSLDSLELKQGQVALSVDQFALTANNITYGVAGDLVGYWHFFPAEGDFGRIPVWGVGTVVQSANDNIKVHDRYYGYFPMASYLVVEPVKASPRGFNDGTAHRQALPPVYNQYSLVSEANGFKDATLPHQMVYRPLFTTSFVLDDYLADNDFFGAKRVILSSASSKTAFGLAFLLHQRKDVIVCGLTSAQNAAFVKGMGTYDEVLTYDEVESLDRSGKAVYVDMAGNREVLARVHQHYGEQLVCSAGVGITHRDAWSEEGPASLPGAKPSMFFAPDQIEKRNKDWGPEKFQQALTQAWDSFLGEVDTWVCINYPKGADQLTTTYETVLAGGNPAQAYVVSL
ncbi:MAG: DUF2855 family protein [Pseudomonadales bacterium]